MMGSAVREPPPLSGLSRAGVPASESEDKRRHQDKLHVQMGVSEQEKFGGTNCLFGEIIVNNECIHVIFHKPLTH